MEKEEERGRGKGKKKGGERRKKHLPELGLGPLESLDTATIQLGHGERHAVGNVLVEDAHEDDGDRGEEQVEHDDVRVLEEVGHVEVAVYLKPEDGKGPHHVLVEEVGDGL